MTDYRHDSHGPDWEEIGRRAEHFARRVAHDAEKFAERLAEHASGLARDFSREWSRRERHGGPGLDDVRAVLNDVRTLVDDVLKGVDDVITRFQGGDAPADAAWARVVAAREAACGACGRRIGPGEDCHLRRTAEGREFRCMGCPPPATV